MLYLYFIYYFIVLLLHNVPVSDTNIYISDLYLDVEITLEASDVRKAIQSNELSQSMAESYIDEHFNLRLDEQQLNITYCHYSEQFGHLTILGETPIEPTQYIQLHVENSILVNTIENQSNNIYCHYSHLFKGYLMNKERQTITIGLTN